jgi:hypothetical protein
VASTGLVDSGRIFRFDGATGTLINDLPLAPAFPNPAQFIFGPNGDLYVAEVTTDFSAQDDGVVERYDGTSGAFVSSFTVAALRRPWGLAFGPDSNLYVGGLTSNNVVRFTPNGDYIDVFVPGGSGQLQNAYGMTFFPFGRRPSPGRSPHTGSRLAVLMTSSLSVGTNLSSADYNAGNTINSLTSAKLPLMAVEPATTMAIAESFQAGLLPVTESRSQVCATLVSPTEFASDPVIDTLFGQLAQEQAPAP